MGLFENIGKLASPAKTFGTQDVENPAPRAKAITEKDVLPPRALKRLKDLVKDAKKKKTAASAASTLTYEVSMAGVELQSKWTEYENGLAAAYHQPSEADKAKKAEELAEHRAELAEASAASKVAAVEATEAHGRHERAHQEVAKAIAAGKPRKEAKVNLRGVTAATITASRNELAGRRSAIESTEDDFNETCASIDSQVATIAKPATLTKGRKGWRISFPRELVGMGSYATDAAALFAHYFPEVLAADLKAQARRLIGDRPTMTAAARRAALASIDAELLTLDYAEAELAWQAYEAGAPLTFRNGMSASCMLGLE